MTSKDETKSFIDLLKARTGNSPIESGIATFLNPYSYVIIRQQESVIKNFGRIYFDGIALRMAAKFIGISTDRISFDMTSLAPIVFNEALKKNWRIALIGGEPGIAEIAAKRLRSEFPSIRIEFTSSGFFRSPLDRQTVIDHLRDNNYDLVIAGMGTPTQEYFLTDLYSTGWKGIGYTCGGFLHQTAARGTRYYPRIIDKLNLRWAFRIYDEPKLFWRYATQYPKFAILFLYDSLKAFLYTAAPKGRKLEERH